MILLTTRKREERKLAQTRADAIAWDREHARAWLKAYENPPREPDVPDTRTTELLIEQIDEYATAIPLTASVGALYRMLDEIRIAAAELRRRGVS